MLEEYLSRSEGKTFEFKENRRGLQAIVKTVVASANSFSGTIIIGIKDRTKDIAGIGYMLELIIESNSYIFDELAQDYENEFSPISGKKKNQDGKYPIDADWRAPNVGYYWKEASQIVGFSIEDPRLDRSFYKKGRTAYIRSLEQDLSNPLQ